MPGKRNTRELECKISPELDLVSGSVWFRTGHLELLVTRKLRYLK